MISKRKSYVIICQLALTLLILLTHVISAAPVLAQSEGELPVGIIFDSKTSDEYLELVYGELGPKLAMFTLGDHWTPRFTAMNDGLSSAQGESLTLTWSIIPDGTYMPAQFSRDTSCNSSLNADLNTAYGTGNWLAEIEKVFDDWSSKTANVYVFEPNDDGASWPGSKGVVGVRGDLRIGGCTIDGDSNALAFNIFPSNGDMKIDSKDAFYSGNLTTGFHNVISHEHGHGAGVGHVCPINQTKLMEPFLSRAFIGLQHDDIRAIQRHYGDRNELIGGLNNDVYSRATNLGSPADGVSIDVADVSIDDNDDEDWYSFSVSENRQVDVAVTPKGSTYLSGPQNPNGTCTAGIPVNSLAVHNLDITVVDADGSTVLATAGANGAGLAESLSSISLGAAGVKYLHVVGSAADDIQLYDLQFTVKGDSAPPTPTNTFTDTPVAPTPTTTPTTTPTDTPVAPPTPTVTPADTPIASTPTAIPTDTPVAPTPTATSTDTTIPPTPTATRVGTTTKSQKKDARDALVDQWPTGNSAQDRKIRRAIVYVNRSLSAHLWTDDEHLTYWGAWTFYYEKMAVRYLMRVASTDPFIEEAMMTLVSVDKTLAEIAIDDARGAGGTTEWLAQSELEMERAQRFRDQGRPDKAIDRYKRAWGFAILSHWNLGIHTIGDGAPSEEEFRRSLESDEFLFMPMIQ